VGQQRFPAAHALVHRLTQRGGVHRQDRLPTCTPRSPQPRDPRRVQVLDRQRLVARRPWSHGQYLDDPLQPPRHLGRRATLDGAREHAAFHGSSVVQAAHAVIEQSHHVLRSRWLLLPPVLRLVQLPNQTGWISVRHAPTPVAHGHRARGGGHAAAVHPSERRLNGHRHHGARWLRVQPGDEGLVDPTAGERHAVGNRPDDPDEISSHGGQLTVRLPDLRSRYCCSIQR
jgi:hypothetical protein